MKNTRNNDILATVISKYVIASEDIYPLSAESLVFFFCRLCETEITEKELTYGLVSFGFHRMTDCGCTKFRIKFRRDIRIGVLFDYYDTSTCQSEFRKCLIQNAQHNTSCRMKTFCKYVIHQPELCEPDIDDNEVMDYIQWLCRHTPSPKSTFAAVVLYQLSSIKNDHTYFISPEQMQFIRENPDLKLNINICK